jgi:hypothetical protein
MNDPHTKPLKEIDWLVRSYAITNLPSIASLKTLRAKLFISSAQSPMIAFADPIFVRDRINPTAALRSLVKLYGNELPDLASLAKALPHPRLWAPFVVVGEPAKPHDAGHAR